jgi:hypothetical protein
MTSIFVVIAVLYVIACCFIRFACLPDSGLFDDTIAEKFSSYPVLNKAGFLPVLNVRR